MLSFVKFDEHNGIWANRDRALALMEQGYRVYKDNVDWEELSRSEIEAMVERDSTGEDEVKAIKAYSEGD